MSDFSLRSVPSAHAAPPKAAAPAGGSLAGLEGQHVFNSTGFARSADMPADHPDKAALIRATHAQRPLEIAPGVHAYPMSWKEPDIQAYWARVKAEPVDPTAFDLGKRDRPPVLNDRPKRESKLQLPEADPRAPAPATPPAPAPPRAATPTPAPRPDLRGVQDLTGGGGYWFKDFKDRVSGTSIVSNTPGYGMDVSMARGVGNTSPSFVLRDSRGSEIYRFEGAEAPSARFVFTEDGKFPASLDPKRERYLKALKVGETYAITASVTPLEGHPNANSDWFRLTVRGTGQQVQV